jgi:metal-dependent amidase/aminoacylase/carboxypeptidase family protein
MRRTLGDEKVLQSEPSMGGEDFSRYGKAGIPICMFKLGAVNPQRLVEFKQAGTPPPSLHSAKFYPDPAPTLTIGMTVMGAAALELLGLE